MILTILLACGEEVVETQSEFFEQNTPLDLEDPGENTLAFVKMRGSLDESEEIIFYWHGYIYNQESVGPFEATQTSYFSSPVLAFEGYNVARLERINDTEYQMLSREITVYKNLFGQIIDCFDTGTINDPEPKLVPVAHVLNDPVNFVVGESNYKEIGEYIVWDMDMFLTYPSPLPVEDYSTYSAGNTYQSVELFDFYSKRTDLEDSNLETVPVHLTWVRHGQYLPWMQVGQKEGNLIYHAQGYKVEEGWDGLPKEIKVWTEENAPEFKTAPMRTIPSSNMTSWRYMKQLLDNDEYPSNCQ